MKFSMHRLDLRRIHDAGTQGAFFRFRIAMEITVTMNLEVGASKEQGNNLVSMNEVKIILFVSIIT